MVVPAASVASCSERRLCVCSNALACCKHVPDVDAMRGLRREVACQLTVEPEVSAAEDGATGYSRHETHSDKWILMTRRRRVESAGDHSITLVEGCECKCPAVSNEGLNLRSTGDGDDDERGLGAALEGP